MTEFLGLFMTNFGPEKCFKIALDLHRNWLRNLDIRMESGKFQKKQLLLSMLCLPWCFMIYTLMMCLVKNQYLASHGECNVNCVCAKSSAIFAQFLMEATFFPSLERISFYFCSRKSFCFLFFFVTFL